MAVELIMPSRILPVGPWQHQIDKDCRGFQGVRILCTREDWPEGTVAELTIIMDSPGSSVRHGAILPGGVIMGRDGQPRAVFSAESRWPGEAAKDHDGHYLLASDGQRIRQVMPPSRIVIELNVLQSIRTAITVELF